MVQWPARARPRGGRLAMSIRTKVFALAGILLLLFGAVIGVLALLQRNTLDHLGDMATYHRPLTQLLADVDVATFEYELLVERMRRRTDRDEAGLQRAAAEVAAVADRLREDFARVHAVLDGAIDYNAHDPQDLFGLARIQGAMK